MIPLTILLQQWNSFIITITSTFSISQFYLKKAKLKPFGPGLLFELHDLIAFLTSSKEKEHSRNALSQSLALFRHNSRGSFGAPRAVMYVKVIINNLFDFSDRLNPTVTNLQPADLILFQSPVNPSMEETGVNIFLQSPFYLCLLRQQLLFLFEAQQKFSPEPISLDNLFIIQTQGIINVIK